MINLIIELFIIGIIMYLVSIAPFVNAQIKEIINYVLIVIGVVLTISFLLGYTGTNLLNR